MQPIFLTPILRRTFAIFRERPALFLAFPFAYAAISEMLALLPKNHAGLNAFLFLFFYAIAGTLSAAIVISLTLDAQQGIAPTLAAAWQRVRIQPHLTKTAGGVILYMAGVGFVFAFAAALLFAIWSFATKTPHSGHAVTHHSHTAITIAACIAFWIFDFVYAPIALAISLLYIKRPSETVDFKPLDESRHYARTAYWGIVTILIASTVPRLSASLLGGLIHLPATIAPHGVWAGRLLLALLSACTATLTHIALTLIALNRVATESSSKPAFALGSSPRLSPPVILH